MYFVYVLLLFLEGLIICPRKYRGDFNASLLLYYVEDY